MLVTEVVPKPKRFTDFAATDLMIRHCLAADDGTQRVVYEIGTVRQMVWYFGWMESTLQRVARSKQPAVSVNKRGQSFSEDAKAIWHVFRNFDVPEDAYEGRKLSPWLTIGLHLAKKWEPRLRDFTCNGMLDARLEYPRNAMKHIFRVIRRVCRSNRFRSLVKNDKKKERDNYLSCCKYMLDIFRIYARLLVLRIDLYFEGDAKIFSESEEAGKAYDKFLRNLSECTIVPGVLGYVGKRENGLDRRIHFHVLVALDGSEHRQAYSLTEELGRYWVNSCVGSPIFASYINCFVRKDEYEFNCIGLLHYTDESMLKGLRGALLYLCKEGAHILVGEGMGRNLRKGQSPEFPDYSKRLGAPRKHGNDLSLAKRILLAKE